MIALLGNLALCGAVLASAGAVLASACAGRSGSPAALRAARRLTEGPALALTAAGIVLAAALLRDDFRFAYVAGHSQRALPAAYKLAAFWSGQEGSLLLWAWLVAVFCAIASSGLRRLGGAEHAASTATMGVVATFFGAILLFAANPFELVPGGAPPDGRGLNPQLQDPAMVAHPLLLFAGYAGLTIPFAVMVGALAAGRADNRWLAAIRRWLLVSWMLLGTGILLGAWWAYVELGWGGYWAWDPVENASLLPWLTCTALMHSIMVQQHRGMFKRWNASLIALTFGLCIFGTWLTRSGAISSVHAFAPSLLGVFFLSFLGVALLGSAAMIAWRWGALAPERRMEGVVSREGAFLAGNVLLLVMAGVTLVGTIFPILSAWLPSGSLTVKPAFYNRVVAPMGLLLVGLMTAGPMLTFGRDAARRIARNLAAPAAGAAAVVGASAIFVTRNPWALLCVALAALGTFAVIADFARTFSARRRATGERRVTAALRLMDRDHRRYGGQLAHLGLMLIVVGVAGSSLFAQQHVERLRPGESARAGRYVLRFQELTEVRGANYSAVEAVVELGGESGPIAALRPQRRLYDNWNDEPNNEIALRSTWREDVYVTLAGWDRQGVAAIQVRINPLAAWIWIGGTVLAAGALLAALPPLLARSAAHEAAAARAVVTPPCAVVAVEAAR